MFVYIYVRKHPPISVCFHESFVSFYIILWFNCLVNERLPYIRINVVERYCWFHKLLKRRCTALPVTISVNWETSYHQVTAVYKTVLYGALQMAMATTACGGTWRSLQTTRSNRCPSTLRPFVCPCLRAESLSQVANCLPKGARCSAGAAAAWRLRSVPGSVGPLGPLIHICIYVIVALPTMATLGLLLLLAVAVGININTGNSQNRLGHIVAISVYLLGPQCTESCSLVEVRREYVNK